MSYRTKASAEFLNTHLEPTSLSLTLYSPEEIRKLSVAEIRTTLVLDALGLPLPSGVHDPCLGPTVDKGEPCKTCRATYMNCPGHLGHIELPLPVVNPLFYKTVHLIVRMSCASCFSVQLPAPIKHLFSLQMKLLSEGYAKEAQEAESIISAEEHINDTVGNWIINKEKLDQYYDSVVNPISNQETGRSVINESKLIQAVRNDIISSLPKKASKDKSCIYCKKQLTKYSSAFNKLYFTVTGVAGKSDVLGRRFLNPQELRDCMRELWKNESEIILALIPSLHGKDVSYPTDLLFLEVIPVLPIRIRPVSFLDDKMTFHPQTAGYNPIINDCLVVQYIVKALKSGPEELSEDGKNYLSLVRGETLIEKLHHAWSSLQGNVDCVMDSEISALSSKKVATSVGLKQIMEKKDGCIRMNMMGKRVNFAARSVITPDPYLDIEEIGVPEDFARVLTYPTPVTSWNVSDLRKMVINGPLVHPGAVMVEVENGKVLKVSPTDPVQRESVAKCLLTPDEDSSNLLKGIKVVHRHLINGDILLLNRQPTLHRPSIMAHKARILKKERTFRLHYANCKSYNADFDGDEMNAHFPQNELARSEAYNLVCVSNHYLVPKDGTPLSGLIQDHIIAGFKMTVRGRFFNKDDYQQLSYQALNMNRGLVRLEPPSIMKPVPLWSGKQIISTVIINLIPPEKHCLNLKGVSKISAKAWENAPPRAWKAGGTPLEGSAMSEAEVIIRGGELLCGVLDKTHCGSTPYGLVHCFYELYGGKASSRLLSAFSKLFTYFQQIEGFTLGVEDILVVSEADKQRSNIIKAARNIGDQAVSNALDLENSDIHQLKQKLDYCYGTNKAKYRSLIDRSYKTMLDSYTNQINKQCLPAGLIKKFPSNNLQLMVQSGAKGSTVNTMQISCLLGQIELEGKRPPLMVSGKSLPSFPQYDMSPRAGGFVDGRFMTGIQPQEFFFHCMAGREGLIDTAVKTSRSGYLQRCLIKHLEGLIVHYDQTVRDSDGSLIQLYYGEDGIDIAKAQFLTPKQIPFIIDNFSAMDVKEILAIKNDATYNKVRKLQKKVFSCLEKSNSLKDKHKKAFTIFSSQMTDTFSGETFNIYDKSNGRSRGTLAMSEEWQTCSPELRHKYEKKVQRCPDPVVSQFQSDRNFGAITERIEKLMNDYFEMQAAKGLGLHQNLEECQERMFLKSMRSQCPPGEPVGLLAAQSIGEPSTQMTLNTFHFAGRGDMNVTLGIPRLREILMTASKVMKTPMMDIPFNKNISNLEKKADNLRKKFSKVTLFDVIEKVAVENSLQFHSNRKQVTTLKFQFLPHASYKTDYVVTPKYIINYFEKNFVTTLVQAIKKQSKASTSLKNLDSENVKVSSDLGEDEEEIVDDPQPKKSQKQATDMGEAHQSSDEDEDAGDEDATMAQVRTRHTDLQEYEDPEEEDQCNVSDDGFVDDDEIKQSNDTGTAESFEQNVNNGSIDYRPTPHAKQTINARALDVISKSSFISNYRYDSKNYMWCELQLSLDMGMKMIDYSTLLKEVTSGCVMWQVPHIKRAFTFQAPSSEQLVFRTDGINIFEVFQHYKLLDLNKLYTNDIHGMANKYGIEAGRRVIVKEVQDVFNVYGITVDPRHLLLIADYMTFNGVIEPLNRTGMEKNTSPLQQMTFESSLTFLKTAAIRGKKDSLESPSSRLMMGLPAKGGTGILQIIQAFDGSQLFGGQSHKNGKFEKKCKSKSYGTVETDPIIDSTCN